MREITLNHPTFDLPLELQIMWVIAAGFLHSSIEERSE